jgi:transglutaminase-like putative cysteine protease
MKLKVGCELNYGVRAETTFIFNFEVAHIHAHSGVVEQLTLVPPTVPTRYVSPDHNRYLKISAGEGELTVSYSAEIDLLVHRANPMTVFETPVCNLPLEVLAYLLPSRFVPSDRLASFAQREFSHLQPGHSRVNSICSWIYENIGYERGISDPTTTASETLIARAGVCRDFAHLGIAFCRALGIPARFATCYAHGLSPDDFHAVFEAYLGERWWLFDGTRRAALDRLVRIGIGRDAAEVAFATAFGSLTSGPPRIWVESAAGEPEPAELTTDAISTATIGDADAAPQ